MNKLEKRFILLLLLVIIICSTILIYKIKNEKKYDEQLYSEIYSEYNEIFIDNDNKIENNADKSKDKNIYIYTNTSGVSYRVIASITIPKLEIVYPVITETTDEYLKVSICKLAGGEPNEPGNLSLIGHNYKNSQFFSKLGNLENRRYC